jgi:hypothetical protein
LPVSHSPSFYPLCFPKIAPHASSLFLYSWPLFNPPLITKIKIYSWGKETGYFCNFIFLLRLLSCYGAHSNSGRHRCSRVGVLRSP